MSNNTGRILGMCSGVGFLITAGLHATGYDSISALAQDGPEPLRPIVPMLWVAFSVDLLVVGIIVLAAAWLRTRLSRLVLIVAGCMPLSAAVLQLLYLKFIPPTAILLALTLLTWIAAATLKPGETRGGRNE